MARKVCLVIPAYNEATTIVDVINGLRRSFKNTKYDVSIVVVDDGSRDDTAKLAKSTGAHVISHVLNSGSGGATATGLSYAQRLGVDVAATVDADGQHDPDDVVQGIKLINSSDHDLLIGSRLIDSSGMSLHKRIGNKGLSVITYLLFGVNVTDSQSGLRIFSAKALNELKWRTSGYEFCSEMLWRAKQQGLQIGEFPAKAIYTEYSKSKGQNNWNAINIIKSLLRRRIVEIIGE